jgi:hypothetical protein
MGWNSWDSYGTTVTEAEVLANARFLAEHLAPLGWDTVVIDIDWSDPSARSHGYNQDAPLTMDEHGRLLPDPVRFPSSAGGIGDAAMAARESPQLGFPAPVVARELMDENDGRSLPGFFYVQAIAVMGDSGRHGNQGAGVGRGRRCLNQSAIWLPVMKSTLGWPASRSSISSK